MEATRATIANNFFIAFVFKGYYLILFSLFISAAKIALFLMPTKKYSCKNRASNFIVIFAAL
jgi:hypothetical protein